MDKRIKDYSNSDIINNNGISIHITDLKRKNSKNEKVYGYICCCCGKESEGTIEKIKKYVGCKFCKGKNISKSESLSLDCANKKIHKCNANLSIIDYKTGNEQSTIKCNKHNIIFKKKLGTSFYKKLLICPKCSSERKRELYLKYTVDDIQDILNKSNCDWLNKNEYTDASSNLICKCKICGYVSTKNISQILNGRKCKQCSGLLPKTTKQYIDEVYNLVQDEYKVLGEYISCQVPIKMKHNKCGHMWNVRPVCFLYKNTRCPSCNQSKGELLIEQYLLNNNIQYVPQYAFKDCKYKKSLRFDFYIQEFNLCIEFQGIQHYEPIDYFGGISSFEICQERDMIKKKYCSDNNINLLEIKYNDIDKITTILDSVLNNS